MRPSSGNGLESLQLDCSGGAATPPTAAQAAAAARLISDRSSYSNVARVLADACPGAHGGASGCFVAFDVLLGLPTVRALRTFTLTSSSRWTDAHALGLRQQLPNLIKLRLESCPQLSDRGALELARLPNLRALSLIRNPQLSAVALQALAALSTALESLDVEGCGEGPFTAADGSFTAADGQMAGAVAGARGWAGGVGGGIRGGAWRRARRGHCLIRLIWR